MKILHIDMNSYFATCEQQSNPHLRGKPIAVGGDPRLFYSGQISRVGTIIVAASKEAKARGVKSVMPSWEALKICPDLIFVSGDHAKYKWVTDKFLKIFESYSPVLEIFSIDEAFLELANTRECPTATNSANSFDEAVRVAKEIKKRLKSEIGEWMTCSIGIAENKLLAKLASDMQKPDGLVIINKKNKYEILNKIELTDFCGIGKRIEKRLNKMGISSVKQLRKCPYNKLIKEFKSYGHKLYLMARGEDNSRVVPYFEMEDEKSMGHNYTLPKDLWDKEDIKAIILQLSEKVGRRLRRGGFVGGCVTLVLRYSFENKNEEFSRAQFRHFHKQKRVKYFFNDGYEIYKIACNILEQWKDRQKIRMIGISVSKLCRSEQLTCLDEIKKQKRILKACDKINDRYGESTVFRGGVMQARKFGDRKAVNRPISFMKRV